MFWEQKVDENKIIEVVQLLLIPLSLSSQIPSFKIVFLIYLFYKTMYQIFFLHQGFQYFMQCFVLTVIKNARSHPRNPWLIVYSNPPFENHKEGPENIRLYISFMTKSTDISTAHCGHHRPSKYYSPSVQES